MPRAGSGAESLCKGGQVVAHIPKIKQTAVCTRLVIKIMMVLMIVVVMVMMMVMMIVMMKVMMMVMMFSACLLQTDPRPFPLFPFAHHFLEPGEFVPLLPLSSRPPFKPGEFALLPSLPFLLSRTGKETSAHLLRGEKKT